MESEEWSVDCEEWSMERGVWSEENGETGVGRVGRGEMLLSLHNTEWNNVGLIQSRTFSALKIFL